MIRPESGARSCQSPIWGSIVSIPVTIEPQIALGGGPS